MTVTDETATKFMHDAMPFTAVLGMEVITSTPDEVRARVPWDASRCTSGGLLHGGLIMALADSCGGASAFFNLPDGATGTTTIESKTNFFRGVRAGYVEAVSKPLHKGRTTIVIDTELFDADGKRVARVTQTQAVLRG
jgi:1,4-dihydroxy-2-naphthoyl-CoA hydrolase